MCEKLDSLHHAAQDCAGAARAFLKDFGDEPEPSLCDDVAWSRARERLRHVHHAIDDLREYIAAWDSAIYGPTLDVIGQAINGRLFPFITVDGTPYLTAHEAAGELAKAVLRLTGGTTCKPGSEAQTVRALASRLREFGDVPDLEARLQAEYFAAKGGPADSGDDDNQGDGMTWQEAQTKADEIRLQGAQFTSYLKMAKRIGCSRATLHKAIEHKGTVELQEWAKKQRGVSRLNASPEVAAVAIENTRQAREPDPAAALEDADVDVAMAYLLDQAGPHERAAINALSPAARRRLAEAVYQRPDLEEQTLHRRSRDR